MSDEQSKRVRFEEPAPGVARVVLTRASKRNAQDAEMIYQLDAALTRAANSDTVSVIILAADGPDFSSGHDLAEKWDLSARGRVTQWGGFSEGGNEGHIATEAEVFLGMCWRWRNLPKPTIAQVQGRAVAAGLMLAWTCDLIVAARDAVFSDPTVAFAMPGVEFFVHPWELGARRAKMMLFTGDSIDAEEAREIGMVSRVVSRGNLATETLELASRIALRPRSGLRWSKQSVNQAIDAQGLWSALQSAFSMHQLGHAQNLLMYGQFRHPDGASIVREQLRRDDAPKEEH